MVVERARINYAAVLHENGRTREAASIYESMMLTALETGNDKSALHAGHNLIYMFMQNDEPLAARRAFTELKPLIERNPNIISTGSLLLRELDLLRLEGKVDQAIEGLQSFIQQSPQPRPILIGAAHRLLADAFVSKNDLDRALEHAKEASDLLKSNANEILDANLTLARVYIGRKEYSAALDLLNAIDVKKDKVPSRQRLAISCVFKPACSSRATMKQALWLAE